MTLTITPSGHLVMVARQDSESGIASHPFKTASIEQAFATSQAAGIMMLAGEKSATDWPLSWIYWRDFGTRYLLQLCQTQPTSERLEPLTPPDESVLTHLILSMPPMPGGEYCTPDVIAGIWIDLDNWAMNYIAGNKDGLAGFLQQYAPLWRQVGRVCFHLAENKKDPEFPFAFMATYVPRLGKNARAQHLPLNQALSEYAGANNREALLRLLEPVYSASTRCNWVQELLESNDIYYPLAWSPEEAYLFLKDVPLLEESGLVVRLPDWWKKRPRPRVQVSIGSNIGESLSAMALLDFRVQLTLNGADLTPEEIAALTAAGDGLAFLRGQWVEVNGEKLREALEQWRRVEAEAGGLSFVEGMRLLAGARRDLSATDQTLDETGWAFVEVGDRLREMLAGLREPARLASVQAGSALLATLRPYQQTGLNWLWFLSELGLGACLADDMGLGKTIQVISLLLAQKGRGGKTVPSLLVLPASLLSNWKSELARFAPSLSVVCLHSSEMERSELDRIAANAEQSLSSADAVLTTYGMLQRQEWLRKPEWNLIVLDEAQAIKNSGTQQAKAVKTLIGRARIALTGTPVENRLSDLWSLFDFICPGLLGNATRFKQFVSCLEENEPPSYAPLRSLVQPYILRRLKSDKNVISDLPDKVEMSVWCGLSKAQARIYAQAVKDLAEALAEQQESGMKRRGLILSSLMRFKQICNHPGQALGDGDYAEERSGKFIRLRELAEEIASRQEKVLIFTQFREMTAPIAAFLATLFGRPGLVLHGGTPVAERKKLVDRFLHEDGPPFFVLSLKAGGSGLNLTAASHVIHFDRWWNPAVENQATDRAFRIGQNKNVMVHKFVCKGTIEEKIDALIAAKAGLATELLEGTETLLTEMDDDALLKLVALDLEKTGISA